MDILIAMMLFVCALIFIPGAWKVFWSALCFAYSALMIIHRLGNL
jgi:hypothetical protein